MESPFDVLHVDEDADEAEIKRAYRERVKEVHPDQGGSAEEFQRLRDAYEFATTPGGTWETEASTAEPPEQAGDSATARDPPPQQAERATEDEDDQDEDEQREPRSRVEYLDYEAVADHGWSIEDEDLFEKAAEANLGGTDRGEVEVPLDEFLLDSVEDCGLTWPYSCRGSACANCAVAVLEGDLAMPSNHVLPEELLDRGIRLSCVGEPTTEELKVVYNVKHLPDLEDLRLPPGPFANVDLDD